MLKKLSILTIINFWLKSICRVNKNLFYSLFQNLLIVTPPKVACGINNFKQKLFGRKIFTFYDNQKKLYKVVDGDFTIYFNEKMRGINTYAYGICDRANFLADTYSLNLVKFNNNDVFIDCGANFGDLHSWILLNRLSLKYISFEPSPEEFRCLTLNCKNQENNNIALSNLTGFSHFYIKSDTGDSSLIVPAEGYNKKILVKTTTLDEYVNLNKIEKIKFLKIEAEGSEPEILEGSKKIINRVHYIGVDGSPERGVKAETTIEFASNFLLKNGFEMLSIKFGNSFVKALFRNSNFIY
jgi:FkbM family methyltransferase